jgi:16S rRNA (adenine1518-N6/adenine1519-N6)-dimethyltransferase
MTIRAKKHLGQHFLKDDDIARKIVDSLTGKDYSSVLEIGPGTGVLTKYLVDKPFDLSVIEIDRESVSFLKKKFTGLKITEGDFLEASLTGWSGAIIGNFPYNISSQILFKVLDHKDRVPEVVGMFQKEVAERIAAKPGIKAYGIVSVLLQAYYNIEYLFTVHENVFSPPPKVKSAVIRLTRNATEKLSCDEVLFAKVVKVGFNQRRKMLRNSLHAFINADFRFATKRPEELSVSDFVELTNFIASQRNPA